LISDFCLKGVAPNVGILLNSLIPIINNNHKQTHKTTTTTTTTIITINTSNAYTIFLKQNHHNHQQ